MAAAIAWTGAPTAQRGRPIPWRRALAASMLCLVSHGVSRVAAQAIPAAVRVELAAEVEGYVEDEELTPAQAKPYLDRLTADPTEATAAQLLRELVHLAVSVNRLASVAELAQRLDRPEMEAFRESGLPPTITVTEATLVTGEVILCTPSRALTAHSYLGAGRLGGQVECSVGVGSLETVWFHPQVFARVRQIQIALPKRWSLDHGRERLSFDAEGRLTVGARWYAMDLRRVVEEAIVFEPRYVLSFNTYYEHAGYGIQRVVRSVDVPALASRGVYTPAFRADVGWDAPPPPPPAEPAPAALTLAIDDLRSRAPAVVWPSPFDPDPARARRALADLDRLVDDDAERSLLRLRFALTYGDAAPARASADPLAFLAVDQAARAVLDGEADATALARVARDWREAAAALRHAPAFRPAPTPGFDGDCWVGFPGGYSGWREYPVAVALHTQGRGHHLCEMELSKWKETLPDPYRMALLVPDYGAESGAPRSREDDEMVLAPLRRALLRHAIDPDRVYLTGMSMGGGKTWHLVESYPGTWAAALPRGHGPVWVGTTSEGGKLRFSFMKKDNLRGLPIMAMVGGIEGLTTLHAREIAEWLTAQGSPIVLREFGLVGHADYWWLFPSGLKWLAAQRRDPHPAGFVHVAFRAMTARRAWLDVRSVKRHSNAWELTDGGYSPQVRVAIRASARAGEVDLEVLDGDPEDVAVHWDPVLMGEGPITVRYRRRGATAKTLTWTPVGSIAAMVADVLATGDRARCYPDVLVVRF